jgi:hypothetical protein
VEEDAAADDVVLRGVELEEQQLARIEGAEALPASWFPEVDLVDAGPRAEEAEPCCCP